MIIRAIAGAVLGGALSLGALYGAYTYLGLTPYQHSLGALVDEAADIEPGEFDVEEEFEGEPPIDRPYGDGGAAAWLAETLAGPYQYDDPYAGEDEGLQTVDLAALAQIASETPETVDGEITRRVSASCEPSHVLLACNVSQYWKDETGGESTEHSVTYAFNMQQDIGGAWVADPDSIRVVVAG